MNPEQAWQSVLAQLQTEMPKASFDNWMRETQTVSLGDGLLTIRARNADARDWLESRLTSTVQRLLIGILNQSVSVQFVAGDSPNEDSESDDKGDEQEVAIEPVQWLDYDKIVQPHKQVVVKGYLRRLGMEIGPKAIWLYIGFHQAAWMVHATGKEPGMALLSREIMRFSGLSNGAFWRLLKQPAIQTHLAGLVQRMDPPDARRFRHGRDGRPHRVPVRYQVFMAPRLTRSDAAALYSRVKQFLNRGVSIEAALQHCLSAEDVTDLLQVADQVQETSPFDTVMDMARAITGAALPVELDHLAQELHRKIVNALGDIHITHYFITQVIGEFELTPAQAWLVTVARDLAYLNWRTGERREAVTFKHGYQEMAALIGSKRFKTVQAWFNPGWSTQRRGGDLRHFLQELNRPEPQGYPDLHVEDVPRTFRVLMDEPLDADGSNKAGADGSNSQAQMGVLVGANGGNMADANGSVLSTLKHVLNTGRKNTSTTQHVAEMTGAAPQFWELRTLLQQNDVHPKVQRELLDVQASVRAFVSWVLYVASPRSGNLSDPLGYAISRLRAEPGRGAGGAFDQLTALHPKDLKALIDLALEDPLGIGRRAEQPHENVWRAAMGSDIRLLTTVRTILFGNGGLE